MINNLALGTAMTTLTVLVYTFGLLAVTQIVARAPQNGMAIAAG